VTVGYQARDDLSGLGQVSYRLLHPQGISHFQYHYRQLLHHVLPGRSDRLEGLRDSLRAPRGLPAGYVGLQELVATDKAGNRLDLNFVQTVHFEVH
jgi:hypothetical protein